MERGVVRGSDLHGLTGFLGARLLLGVGEAPTFPANSKAIGYWFPAQERSLATAIFDSAAKLASAIGVPVIGLMMVRFGWRWSFAATGFISLLYFVLFYAFYRNPSEDWALSREERDFIRQGGAQPEDQLRAAKGAPLKYLLRQRKVWGLVLGFASYNYTFYLLLTWLPSYLSSTHHVDLLHSSLYTSVPWLFATFTDILMGGWLVDKLVQSGRDPSFVRKAILIGGTTLGLGMLGAAYAQSTVVALVWISVAIGIVRRLARRLVDPFLNCTAGKRGNARRNPEFRQSTLGHCRADCHGLCRADHPFVFLGF